jgi:arylsulfate sulfotransferase
VRTLTVAAFAAWCTFAMLLFPAVGRAQSTSCTISLTPSTPSPQLVGAMVVWTTTVTNCGAAPVYQYKLATTNAVPRFRLARDFNLANTLAWGPLQEGSYAVMVTVKSSFAAGDSTSAVVPFVIHSLVSGDQAVVTPTLNPLVALYSAPPCEEESIYVKFRPVSGTNNLPWKTTNKLPCAHGQSRNFLVAGMLANTPYEMAHVTDDESVSASLFFTTGTPPPSLNFPSFAVLQPPGPRSDLSQDVIYHNFVARPQPNAVNLVATDLLGHVEW